MKFDTLSLHILTNNAAFDDDCAGECGRILIDVAARVSLGEISGDIKDINGNTVGDWSFTGDMNT